MLTIRNPPPDPFSYVYSKHQKIKTFGFERKSYFSLKGLMIYESPKWVFVFLNSKFN